MQMQCNAMYICIHNIYMYIYIYIYANHIYIYICILCRCCWPAMHRKLICQKVRKKACMLGRRGYCSSAICTTSQHLVRKIHVCRKLAGDPCALGPVGPLMKTLVPCARALWAHGSIQPFRSPLGSAVKLQSLGH